MYLAKRSKRGGSCLAYRCTYGSFAELKSLRLVQGPGSHALDTAEEKSFKCFFSRCECFLAMQLFHIVYEYHSFVLFF